MHRKFWRNLVMALCAVLAVTLYACQGDEPQEAAPEPPSGALESPHGEIPPVGDLIIDMPEDIKSNWKSVVLVVEDRSLGTKKEYNVNIGDTFSVPDSDLAVEVTSFFPSFQMKGSNITSASNDPDNPAAKVIVMEGGTLVFRGWLFAKLPTTHPFPHQRFGIILKEGVHS